MRPLLVLVVLTGCAQIVPTRDESGVIADDVTKLEAWTQGLPTCSSAIGQATAEGALMATRSACTALACSDGRRCCNQCFLEWFVVEAGPEASKYTKLRTEVLRGAPSVFECSASALSTMLEKTQVRAWGEVVNVPSGKDGRSLEMTVEQVCVVRNAGGSAR
jgi:hypothetical protein